MFSSIFGKRRSSPVEDETPPIPGPRADDGFVVVEPSPSGGLYPNMGGTGGATPYPQRPAPQPPARRAPVEQPFHYLQGVPFSMSRELRMASNTDTYTAEISDLLAFLTSKLNMSSYDYDFSTERSVMKEC